MVKYLIQNEIINKIYDNINPKNSSKGIIIASPTKFYLYHWIRDSAIVMKLIIKLYNETNDIRYFKTIIDYLENESKLQKLPTLSGLGEPKFNMDSTPFMDSWGRPQNDGPALRGLNMINIFRNFNNQGYSDISKSIIEIIKKDLEYTLKFLDNFCFDLWEEEQGYHFYTRVVQAKFIKESLNLFKEINEDNKFEYLINRLENKYKLIRELLSHHYIDDSIIYSFLINGKRRNNDSALLLALCHIDFDCDIVNVFDSRYLNSIYNIMTLFKKEYPINHSSNVVLLGRYSNDQYYEGNPWFICTLALIQNLLFINKNLDYADKSSRLFSLFNDCGNINESIKQYCLNTYNYVVNYNEELNLPEQIDKNSGIDRSVKNLTWNYSELYNTLINI